MTWANPLRFAGFAGLLVSAAVASDLDGRVGEFTGARTRVVWCQQAVGDGDDVFGRGGELQLWGYDSADGRGERLLLGELSNYHRPMIAPGGERVVFNDLGEYLVKVVDWDGGGLRTLTNGIATDVWQDPASGLTWVYRVDREVTEYEGGPITRFRLDDPSVTEVVLDRTDVTWDNVQVSADGARISGQFPHPRAGFASVAEGAVTVLGRGCWTSMAPDRSHLAWIFDGPHRNLHLHAPDGRSWTVNINHAPGIDGYEVYHPRWSNHVRYFAMTGPYKTGQMGRNLIYFGGPAVEIHLGRFSEDFSAVEAWLQLTANDRADFFPDAWIEGGEAAAAALPAGTGAAAAPTVAAAAVPAAQVRLVGRLAAITPTPPVASIAPYSRALVVYTYEVVRVLEGDCGSPRILVAHWGIRDKQPVDLGKALGATYALRLESFDQHPELEGERLLMDTDEFTLPLFYETGP